MNKPHLILAALSLASVGSAVAAYSATQATKPAGLVPLEQRHTVPVAQLRAEGTLVAGPTKIDPELAKAVEPGVMSIVFADQRAAKDFFDEATSMGESVCLSDLGPQLPEFRGRRFWLRSC